MAGSGIPLLNDYKREFVIKRLPQTFLGGLSLKLGYSAPCYVFFCQIIVWFMPFVIGGSFTLAVEVGGLLPLHACIGNGLIVGVLTLLLQITSKLIAKRDVNADSDTHSLSSSKSASSRQMRRLLAEEDEIIFDSCLSSTTFLFIISPKRYYATIVIASIISTFVNGLGMWYCLPYTTFTFVHGYDSVGSIFLFVFSWIVICIAHFPLLLGNSVPETAAYRSVDFYETQNMWRASIVSLFLCAFLVDIVVDSAVLNDVNNVLHIIFCVLPLLWLLGIIPPFDALLLWAMEQFLIFGLGGSCMSTDWRLLFMTVVSSSVLIGLSFSTSTQLFISCSVGIGYIFSTDITSIFFLAFWKLKRLLNCCGKTKVEQFDETRSSSADKAPERVTTWKEILLHIILFSLVFAGSFTSHYFSSTISSALLKSALEYVFIALFVVALLCREVQRVYIIFGIFRNCFYPLSTLSQTQFLKRKKILRIFGIVHGIFLNFLFPLLSSIYLSIFMFSSTLTTLPSIEVALGCVHGLRFVWQRPGSALFSFTIISVLNLIPALTTTTWENIFLGTRLVFLDVCRDRFFLFLDNLWFAFTLTITSWTNKKQRRSSSILLICLNIIFFPVTLVIIAMASALSAPLLPLFTLPIFIIGFPRPNKFWPGQPGSVQANICSDTVYYQQLIGPVSQWFSSEIGLGIVAAQASSRTLQPFYIARTQDRTLWIQVLESGCGYISFSIKGLELQETSCHSLEATRLDDAFDIAFEKSELDLRCMRTNQYAGTSSMTPIDSAFIESHSDAKNSLRGIIDHPDVMPQLRTDFLKALCWVLTQNILSSNKNFMNNNNVISTSSEDPKNSKFLSNSHGPQELSTIDLNDSFHPNAVSVPGDFGDSRSKIVRTPRSDSLLSFSSILSSDEERSVSRARKKTRNNSRNGNAIKMKPMMNGKKKSEADEWSIGSILSDSGYGLPALDTNIKKQGKSQLKPTYGNTTNNGLSEAYIYLVNDKNTHTEDEKNFFQLIPSKWNEIPVSADDFSTFKEIKDSEWMEHCFKVSTDKGNVDVELTPSIVTTLMNLVLSCDAIVNVVGVPGKDSSSLGSEHMFKIFSDNIPWSPALDWLKARKDLHKMILTAYRYAVKLMYDQASLGPAENIDELSEYLSEYDEDWYIGIESDFEWDNSLVVGNRHLFAIKYSAAKEMSARVLTKQSISLHLGRINPAAVRGIWSNLALELIYATNDDEERYSIQAHLPMLRNLLIQTADPPLGYPIYSSPAITESTLPF